MTSWKQEARPYTSEEVQDHFVRHVWHLVHAWSADRSDRTLGDLLSGLAHSFLATLDGCFVSMPGFLVAPRRHPSHRAQAEAEGLPYYPDNAAVSVECDVAGRLHERFYALDPGRFDVRTIGPTRFGGAPRGMDARVSSVPYEPTIAELQDFIGAEERAIAWARAFVLDLASDAPLLFLDGDGVLNHGAYFKDLHAAGGDEFEAPFDPACVARLNALVERAGVYVVVTSTKRLGSSASEFGAELRAAGFLYPERVLGVTPLGERRSAEILAWLGTLSRPNDRYVVLDDDEDVGGADAEVVRPHLVKTRFFEGGLTEAVLDEVFRRFVAFGVQVQEEVG